MVCMHFNVNKKQNQIRNVQGNTWTFDWINLNSWSSGHVYMTKGSGFFHDFSGFATKITIYVFCGGTMWTLYSPTPIKWYLSFKALIIRVNITKCKFLYFISVRDKMLTTDYELYIRKRFTFDKTKLLTSYRL